MYDDVAVGHAFVKCNHTLSQAIQYLITQCLGYHSNRPMLDVRITVDSHLFEHTQTFNI